MLFCVILHVYICMLHPDILNAKGSWGGTAQTKTARRPKRRCVCLRQGGGCVDLYACIRMRVCGANKTACECVFVCESIGVVGEGSGRVWRCFSTLLFLHMYMYMYVWARACMCMNEMIGLNVMSLCVCLCLCVHVSVSTCMCLLQPCTSPFINSHSPLPPSYTNSDWYYLVFTTTMGVRTWTMAACYRWVRIRGWLREREEERRERWRERGRDWRTDGQIHGWWAKTNGWTEKGWACTQTRTHTHTHTHTHIHIHTSRLYRKST